MNRAQAPGLSLLGFSLLLSTAGCGGSDPQVAQIPPPAVTVSKPITRELTDYDEYEGRIEAINTVEIRARISGYINKVAFKDGQEVKEGETLFEIDPRPYEADLGQAKADLKTIKARVVRLEADYKRAEKLRATRAMSQEEFDKVAGDRTEAIAQVSAAEEKVKKAELYLGFTTIEAPIAGRVGAARSRKGNLVTADVTLLTTIVALEPMYVSFDVDERSLLRYKRAYRKDVPEEKTLNIKELNIPVHVALENEVGFPHKGILDFAENSLNPTTGTLRVRGELDNKKRLFTSGMRARVRIPVGDPYQAILVHESAIGTDQSRKFVYHVDAKNVVSRRYVKLGRAEGDLVVISDGLKADEDVIVTGILRARPGLTVKPEMVKMPGAPSEPKDPTKKTN